MMPAIDQPKKRHEGFRIPIVVRALIVLGGVLTIAALWMPPLPRRSWSHSQYGKSVSQALSIREGILLFAQEHGGSDQSSSYPQFGDDWIWQLLKGRYIDPRTLRSPLDWNPQSSSLCSYFYFPPATDSPTQEHLPMIVEDPELDPRGYTIVVFWDRSFDRFSGSALWDLIDGRMASDGAVFKGPLK